MSIVSPYTVGVDLYPQIFPTVRTADVLHFASIMLRDAIPRLVLSHVEPHLSSNTLSPRTSNLGLSLSCTDIGTLKTFLAY
jgi:hypothetical protein